MTKRPLSARFRTPFPPQPSPASLPHIVDCDGLTRVNLKEPGQFECELNQRRDWCNENAPGTHCIEPIGPCPERLTGRRFRFRDERVATLFKLWFETNLWP
jgi:hypothetical protein